MPIAIPDLACNLIASAIYDPAKYLLGKLLEDNLTWEQFKSKHHLSESQCDFLKRYADATVAFAQAKKSKPVLDFLQDRMQRETHSSVQAINENLRLQNLSFAKELSERHFLTTGHHRPKMLFLERLELGDQIKKVFGAGRRWVVLHGDSGIGKNAFASAFFQRFEAEYDHVGWIDYRICLGNSFATAFANFVYEDAKTRSFYLAVARQSARDLRNMIGSKLLVISEVSDWQDVLACTDLLDIENAYILLTSWSPCEVEGFSNLPMPRLAPDEALRIFKEKTGLDLPLADIQKLANDPWLLHLLIPHIPRENAKAARDYLLQAVRGVSLEKTEERNRTTIAQNLFQLSPLDAAEYWVCSSSPPCRTGCTSRTPSPATSNPTGTCKCPNRMTTRKTARPKSLTPTPAWTSKTCRGSLFFLPNPPSLRPPPCNWTPSSNGWASWAG